MTLPQTIIIISLVLIILVVLIGVVLYNNQLKRKIFSLQEELSSVEFSTIEDQIEKLTAMSLSGESLSTFSNWRNVFEKIKKNKIPTINQQLIVAENDNSHYSIFATRKAVNGADSEINELLTDLNDATEVFAQLLQSNHDNKSQLATLLNDYQVQRKNILSNSFKFGAALDLLEDRLTELESDFDTVKNLTSEGDHVEAKRVLTRINAALNSINEMLPALEKAEQEIATEFPGQLDEISSSYKKLLAEEYNFPGHDILEEVKKLRESLKKSKEFQQQLEVSDLVANNELLADQIDHLYDRLEHEIKAKHGVLKNAELLKKQFDQAEFSSENLIKKLDHIDQSYQLTHGELPEAGELRDEVALMKNDFDVDQTRIEEGKAIFSNILVDYVRIANRLTAIKMRQDEILGDVNGLYEAEKIAQGSLDSFAQEVSLIKRKIDRQNLPGLPVNFIDFYKVVVSEIGELNEELQRVRINLETISNKLILVQEDINRLRTETTEIISSAALVELTVQYSNKYIKEESIKGAIAEAMRQYSQEYTYKRALDTIASALEKFEPGAFNRIEADYYNKHGE